MQPLNAINESFAHVGGLLALFTLVHFMADWLPQSHREAYLKYIDKGVRLHHCAIYTLHFVPLLLWLKMWDWTGLLSLAILLVSHYIIDSYWPLYAWVRYIRRPPEMVVASVGVGDRRQWSVFLTYIETPSGRMAATVVDQVAHVTVLLFPVVLALMP